MFFLFWEVVLFLNLLVFLANLEGGSLPCDLILLMNARRIVYYSVCLGFLLLLRMNWQCLILLHANSGTEIHNSFNT